MLPIPLVLTILTALVTIIGSLIGGAHISGVTILVKSGHSSSVIYCLFRWRYMEGRKYTNVLPTFSCPITKGAFDIFLIYGLLDGTSKWMMKKSLQNPVLSARHCESAGTYLVDRSSPRRCLPPCGRAESSLKDGVSLVVFPEGAYTGHMGYFKRVLFQLADELQLEVVPVTIDGSFKILPAPESGYTVTG